MKKILAIIVVVFALSLSCAAPSEAHRAHHRTSVASACAVNSSPGVVTQAEFDKVTIGMSRARVECIFGTDAYQAYLLPTNPNIGVALYKFSDSSKHVAVLYNLDTSNSSSLVRSKSLVND